MHRPTIRLSPIILAIASSVTVVCAQTGPQEDRVLARIGATVITEREFRQRYELLPGQGRDRRDAHAAAKREFLYSLVAEKILSATAQGQGIDREPSMRASTDLVRRLLARDELYREEVQRKVKISADEVTAGLKLARRQRDIVYLHAEERHALDSIVGRVTRPADLRRIARQADSPFLLDSLTVRWGEAEADLESAAYRTPVGRVSPIVSSSVGWFVIGVVSESPDPEWMALDTRAARSKVGTTLRLRKEQRRLDAFTNDAFRDVDGRAIRSSIVRLAEGLRSVWSAAACDSGCTLTAEQARAVVGFLGDHRADTLAVMGERFLTIEEGLTKLRSTSVTIPSPQEPKLEQSLNSILRTWVQQDLLESMAISRGLDGRPEVMNQVAMWRDHYLSEEMIRRVEVSTRFDDLDVYLYLHHFVPSTPLPVMTVRIATGASVADVARFVDEAQGLPLTAQLPSIAGVTVRDLPSQPVSQLGLVASIAWGLRPGEWSRPSVVDSIAVSVQLLERKEPGSKPVEWDSLAAAVRSQKVRRAIADAIARLAQRHAIEVNEELVDAIEVSPVPMMTYRILGFGGRMFAAPFVRPQTDWLTITPRATEPIP